MQAERVTPVASLVEFFKDAVAEAMHRQKVSAADHTAFYIVNLLTLSGFYDVALRDFGLLVGALALARLASAQRASGEHIG